MDVPLSDHIATVAMSRVGSPRAAYHLGRLSGADAGVSWDDVVNRVLALRRRVVAFDVYDTILGRALASEDAYLDLLAERLVGAGAWRGTATNYVTARRTASRTVAGENLAAWYEREPLKALTDAEQCQQIEHAFEASLTVALPGAAEAIDRLRTEGCSIAFLSDMHLPTDVIATLLAEHGMRKDDETLLVSGDVGAWKKTGELFTHWLTTDSVDARDAIYIGNHPYSDCAVPRSMGIAAAPRRVGNPNRYERTIAASGAAGAIVAASSIGARCVDAKDRVAADVGASVIGQAMMGFLLAIRARCLDGDLQQVAFVARDGELGYRMAKAMDPAYWQGINLTYVHGNRLTWTLPGADVLGIERWIEIGTADRHSFLRTEAMTDPAQALDRLDLQPGDVPSEVDLSGASLDVAGLMADENVRSVVKTKAADRFELAAAYLRTCLKQRPTLIVDIGWRGQTAAIVAAMTAEVTGSTPVNFHFGGYGVRPEIDAASPIERYAFDDGSRAAPFGGIDQCIEMFTGAGQPRARGYRMVGDRVEPDFDEGTAVLSGPPRQHIWEAAIRVAEALPSADLFDSLTAGPPDPEAICEILRAFWMTPTPSEGSLASRLAIETDDLGANVVPVVSPYRLRNLRDRSARRWRNGSIAASSAAVRLAASTAEKLRG